jgi:AcrR family transcriptional regulator
MRVTAATREATRRRILDVARARFAAQGFAATTAREIAAEAGVASGTVFNYFSTKEAIVTALIAQALTEAHALFEKQRRTPGSLQEALFSLVALELRSLRPHRKYVGPVFESALAPPLSKDGDGNSIRLEHLAMVERLVAAHGRKAQASPTTMHVYWMIYAGVLSFWASDSSPNQEDTLAVLDQAIGAFLAMPSPRSVHRSRSKS